MKKLFIAALLIVFCFAFAGCGSSTLKVEIAGNSGYGWGMVDVDTGESIFYDKLIYGDQEVVDTVVTGYAWDKPSVFLAFSDDAIQELSGTDSNGNPVDNMLKLDYDKGVKLERQQEFKYTLEDGVLTLIP